MIRRLRLAEHVSPWVRYGVALLIFGVALWVRLTFLPVDGGRVFLAFYPATILALLICGIGPGVVVLLLSAASADYFVMQPFRALSLAPYDVAAEAVFLLTGVLLVSVVRAMRDDAAKLQSAHHELAKTTQRLKSVTESVPISIVYFDTEERVHFANRDFKVIVGRTDDPNGIPASEYLGSPLYEASRGPRMKALAGEPMTFTVDATVQGRPLRREVTYAVDRDANGKIRGVYGLGYDVTRREQLAAQLQRVQQDLAAVLNHMPARITA